MKIGKILNECVNISLERKEQIVKSLWEFLYIPTHITLFLIVIGSIKYMITRYNKIKQN